MQLHCAVMDLRMPKHGSGHPIAVGLVITHDCFPVHSRSMSKNTLIGVQGPPGPGQTDFSARPQEAPVTTILEPLGHVITCMSSPSQRLTDSTASKQAISECYSHGFARDGFSLGQLLQP